jgi:hypothetical protein
LFSMWAVGKIAGELPTSAFSADKPPVEVIMFVALD